MKTLLNVGYYVFIALVVVIGLLLVSSYFQFTDSYQLKVVKSGSMEPAIKTGSLVLISPARTYGEGDVITFGRDVGSAVPTTHRIIGVRAEGGTMLYKTKGDANEEADLNEVARREIIGRVNLSIPILGYLLDFARQPIGFVLLIVLPAIMVAVDEVYKIVKEIKKMRQKRQEHAV
ncbi:MAG: signal peptidase I [Patescibacteria group bacterium]|nr:signal peptidase I [Patescibacteria group bacterium]